jgi:OCT family organic cation transporter-like MFS transporter 4/5
MYFLAAQPNWRCVRNSTVCIDKSSSYPSTNHERCKMVRTEWEYIAERDYSLSTYFDINCDNQWIVLSGTSIFFLGWAAGSIIIGRVSDYYGRKPVIFITLFAMNSVGFLSVFSPNMLVFLICRFFIGLCYNGPSVVSLVLNGEFVDTASRPRATIFIMQTCAVSGVLLCIKAYFLRQWKHLMIACTLPYMFLMIFYKFVPESIRFLYMRGLDGKVVSVLERVAWWNGRKLPDNFTIHPSKLPQENTSKCKHVRFIQH